MKISDISNSITEEFTDFMNRISVIENNLENMQLRLQDEIDKVAEKVAFKKKESALVESKSKALDNKLAEAEDYLKEAKSKHLEAEDYLESCISREFSIKKRQEQLSIQESSAKEQMQDANKRLAWAEMEERRLKFLQKKIDLVTQDESIKKKLKELE